MGRRTVTDIGEVAPSTVDISTGLYATSFNVCFAMLFPFSAGQVSFPICGPSFTCRPTSLRQFDWWLCRNCSAAVCARALSQSHHSRSRTRRHRPHFKFRRHMSRLTQPGHFESGRPGRRSVCTAAFSYACEHRWFACAWNRPGGSQFIFFAGSFSSSSPQRKGDPRGGKKKKRKKEEKRIEKLWCRTPNWPHFWSVFFIFIVPSHVWHQWKALLVLYRTMALSLIASSPEFK